MIEFHLHREDGWIYLGPLRFSWATPIEGLDLPGFFIIGLFDYSLEFGEVDQGAPGVYLTKCNADDCTHLFTLLQFSRSLSSNQ